MSVTAPVEAMARAHYEAGGEPKLMWDYLKRSLPESYAKYIAHMRVALSAAPSPPPDSPEGGWLPIDVNTPKETICIVSPGGGGYGWAQAEYGYDRVRGKDRIGWWFMGCWMDPQPTHWLPISPPPPPQDPAI